MYNRYPKLLLAIILTLSLVISTPFISLAHSGRTDSSGGHRDNQNASGLGYYHYHHGMGPHLHPNGICPYSFDNADNNEPSIIYNLPSTVNNSSYSKSIYDKKISRPYFNVTINSNYCNYTSSEYYPVDIGGIVFIPLSSEMLKVCNLQGSWDSVSGFNLKTKVNTTQTTFSGTNLYTGASNIYSGNIKKPSFPIVINGKNLNMTTSKFYPVDIGGIVFIPLTNDVITTLGMQGGWTAAKGLVLNNPASYISTPTNADSNILIQRYLTVSEGASATCTVYTSNLPEGSIYASYYETDISVVWGDWYEDGNQVDLTVYGLSEGITILNIYYLDTNGNKVASMDCQVTVY